MASILIGLIALVFFILIMGSVSALFLFLMTEASGFFFSHPAAVWGLPLFGLFTGWLTWKWGRSWPNTGQILTDAGESRPKIPFLAAVAIFFLTILSQVFGASTGRESTAVQFGAGLADSTTRFLNRNSSISNTAGKTWNVFFSREAFLRAGLAAGFGAVFGVPWAGAIFALESTHHRKFAWRFLPVTIAASFGAHIFAMSLGASHAHYSALLGPGFGGPIAKTSWSFHLLAQWLFLALVFGISAKLFLRLLCFTQKCFLRVPFFWLRPALGGLIVALLTTFVFQSVRFNGLGLNLIDDGLEGKSLPWDFLWKSLYTVLSTGSGFKGGEVTPLMAIGASLGSAVAGIVSLPASYAASLGLVCVFAAAAHLPWTGALMAWQFFGSEAFLPAFILIFVGSRIVGRDSLFHSPTRPA